MELTYNELRKRDVINVSDGRCLGNIIDLTLEFPRGVLSGITVPGKRTRRIFSFFNKSQVFIDVSRIIKIGSDVILVDLRCGDLCGESSKISKPPNSPPRRDKCEEPCSSHDFPCCEDLLGAQHGNVKIDEADY